MAGIVFVGNTLESPLWAKDFGGRDHILPMPAQLDPSLFKDYAGVLVTASGAAAAGATSIPISALALSALTQTIIFSTANVLITAGTILDFGSGKFARLTANALNGATTITVAPLPTALVGGETSTYSRYSTKYIPSGILISRNNVAKTSTAPFGPAVSTDSEIYLMMFDIPDATVNNGAPVGCELYRHRGLVAENYLPNYAAMLAASGGSELNNQLLAIRSNYETIIGVN